MSQKESAMPKETARKYKPPVHIPLPFVQAVRGLLQVDPKKLPGKGKLTTKAAKKKGKARG
jgi:hypothetical protein